MLGYAWFCVLAAIFINPRYKKILYIISYHHYLSRYYSYSLISHITSHIFHHYDRLQSFAAHLQCWDLLPVAGTILRDRTVEAQKKTGLQRGLYHDLALFCCYLRKGSLDLGIAIPPLITLLLLFYQQRDLILSIVTCSNSYPRTCKNY